MTIELGSLAEMAMVFTEAVVEIPLELHEGLVKVARLVEKTAKDEIGHYQPAVGPFPEWPELAEATKDDRVRKGYTENDPLYRAGDLQADITHEVEGLEALIGTPQSAGTADVMVYQEFGTSRMPARPVLGPAGFRNKAAIQRLVGAALATGLIGRAQVHHALGYDFDVID